MLQTGRDTTVAIRIFLVTVLTGSLAFTGCGETARMRLIGALSYANTFAADPGLILDEFKSQFTDPFILETGRAKKLVSWIKNGQARGAFVTNVPFFMQNEYGCGAAALAGVLSFYAVKVDLKVIVQHVVVPEIGGTICTDMVAYPRTRGLWSEQMLGGTEMLCRQLEAGRPVVCLLGTGISGFGGHYVIVTACAPGKGIICHNGNKADVFVSWRRFEALWGASMKWMLVVCPPQDVDWPLPAKLKNELGRLLHKRGQWEEALRKYEKALESEDRESAKARIHYNIGLAHFALGRLDEAQASFKKALELEPGLPDAANGLAYTYATLGTELEKAELLARSALEAQPENASLYLDTLGFVLHRLGRDNEAVKILREAIEKLPEGDKELAAEIYYHLGLSSASDPGESEYAFRKAVLFSPESTSGRRAGVLLERAQKQALPVDESPSRK